MTRVDTGFTHAATVSFMLVSSSGQGRRPDRDLRRRHGTVISPICATLLLRSLSEPLNSIQSRY
jgi:hypothetical protein